MLRNSLSPAISHKPSPPVTRSASRLMQRSNQTDSFECSTPITRKTDQNYIKTVERNHEVADDYEDTDKILDTSRFVYKEHFTIKERLEMYLDGIYGWPSWKTFHRRFIPSQKSLRNTFILLLLLAVTAKYLQDNLNQFNAESKFLELKKNIEKRIETSETNILELFERQKRMIIDLEEIHKKYGNNETILDEIYQKLSNLNGKVTGLTRDIEYLKEKQLEKSVEHLNTISTIKEENVVTKPIVENLEKKYYGINVANSLIGAKIDEKCSSRTVSAKNSIFFDLISYFMSFKEGYVLLERDPLVPGEAWCTYDNRATLTVNLARWVKPSAVSYQHVKWSGIVPAHAPKTFDVVACRSSCCTETELLVSNCQYGITENGKDIQEQICEIKNDVKPVKHVQYRFRENHGNITKTCAYLVRLYGEVVPPPPIEIQKSEDETKSEFFDYFPSIPYLNKE